MNIQQKAKRILSIDVLRGLVILLMLVDHVRERFFYHHPVSDPMLIADTDPYLFFTRLTAHFCAPIFVFLTGLSAWLYAHPPHKPERSPSSFLFTRGIFLIFLEVTFINFSWFGGFQTLYLQVIWAIGLSMVVLAGMVKLPRYAIGIIGAAIVVGHNLLSPVQFHPGEWGYPWWTILHDRGYLIQSDALSIRVSYPVLPWIGVILLGYFAGPMYKANLRPQVRYQWLLGTGICSLLTLAVVRGLNLYGETAAWSVRDSSIQTLMSFLNFTKYPPSLDFLLLTLGVGTILLFVFERYERKWMRVLKTYGSVPMFFYLIHLYVLLALYKITEFLFQTNEGGYVGVDHVGMVWLISIVLAILLYWPTKAFGEYKRASTMKWIKYF